MKKHNWPLYIIILVNLLFFTFHFAQKTDLHVDEIFSFGQANSTSGPYLFSNMNSISMSNPDSVVGRWYDSNIFSQYMTVQEKEKFAYSNVIKNLSQGVHPPLFHMMLHTVSSFFPNHLSIWQGYMLNMPILALLLIVIYKLALELFEQDKKMADLALVFCGFSLFVLSMAIYIRMYLFWMCLSAILIYLTLKILKQNRANIKEFVLVGGVAFLCFLTHMYALPFVFFFTASTCIWLAYRKNWRLAFQYGGTILFALILAYACFPCLLNIMFYSSRGEQFQKIAMHFDFNIFDISLKFERFYDLIFSEIFNFSGVKVEYLTLFLILTVAWGVMQHIDKTQMRPYAWWMFAFALLYVIFLSFFSPDMGTYDDRYFSPVLVVFALLIFYWLNYFLKTLFLNKHKRIFILAALVFGNLCFLNFHERSVYTFADSSFSELQSKIEKAPVFFNGDDLFTFYNLSYLLRNSDKVFLFKQFSPQVFEELNTPKKGLVFIPVGHRGWTRKENIQKSIIPPQLSDKLLFLGTKSIGIYFYDVYQIR